MRRIHVDDLTLILGDTARYDCPECKPGIIYRAWDQDALYGQNNLVYEKVSRCTQCGKQFEILDGPQSVAPKADIIQEEEENPHVIRGRGLEL